MRVALLPLRVTPAAMAMASMVTFFSSQISLVRMMVSPGSPLKVAGSKVMVAPGAAYWRWQRAA